MGERTPNMNPDCRGVFYGLSAVHTKANLLRAIIEGVSYTLADCLSIVRSVGEDINCMRICGGGGKSPVWRDILANLYKCEISTLRSENGAAYGAAILAGVATNMFDSISSACKKLIVEDRRIDWNPEQAELYAKYLNLYRKLYNSVKDTFTDLVKVDL